MNRDDVNKYVIEDCHRIVDKVRAEGRDDPIVWITGNNYMPPLRAFGHAEEVWQASTLQDAPELWELYVDELETGLDNNGIMITTPDWDNAVYAVNVNRWERVEEEGEGDTLQSEWKLKGYKT